MKITTDTKILYTFQTYLDNLITEKGQGFKIKEGPFYYNYDSRIGAATFASPNKQWVYDDQVAFVPSGITVDGQFIGFGQGCFPDFENGRIICKNIPQTGIVQGRYSTKEFNVYSQNIQEESLIMDSSFLQDKLIQVTNSGVPPYKLAVPACFIFNSAGNNQPLQLGDTDNQKNNMVIRVITLYDNQMQLDQLNQIFKSQQGKSVKILEPSETPLNEYGNIKQTHGGKYNFKDFQTGFQRDIFQIERVMVTKITYGSTEFLQRNLRFAMADFHILYIGDQV